MKQQARGFFLGVVAVSLILPPVRAQQTAGAAPAQAAPPAPYKQEWVALSDEHAKILLDVFAQASPEGAGQLGVEGLDDRIIDLSPGFDERTRKLVQGALVKLKARFAGENDPRVKQDLEILIDTAEDSIKASELGQKYFLTVPNMTQTVFGGLRTLLDDQIPANRRAAALVRLRKYAGIESSFKPISVLAEQYVRSRMKIPGLLYPSKAQLERDLSNSAFFVDGIAKLFEKFQIQGYQEPHGKLKDQLAAYETFVRTEILPRARADFRLPPEVYALNLDQIGVDIPADQLATTARAAFKEIQAEMQQVASQVAREKGLTVTDYRDVIKELKKEQLVGEAILPHYKERLAQIEEIIQREKLVTLPNRPARIRIATPAEAAAVPAPNMRPPRLIGNTGEQGEFILPLNVPLAAGGKMEQIDDFTFAAASWTLTAHEARPGHEMQFARMIEAGVSLARGFFAFNSTNVEGWGLYAEYITKPFMPAEGQLVSLQHRLMRAARAYLDPELQAGKVTPEEAGRVLRDDVVLSNAMATQEVERYTFRSPGQATSYFYGYSVLTNLRQDVEKAMGTRFDAQQFHDFILAQGLLPPRLLRQAVMEHFVKKSERSAALNRKVADGPHHEP